MSDRTIRTLSFTAFTFFIFVSLAGRALAQSTETQTVDEAQHRIQAIEASNAALEKENAALRERIKLTEENTNLHESIRRLGGSKQAPTRKSAPKASVAAVNTHPSKTRLYDAVLPATPGVLAGPENWTGFYIGANAGYGWGNAQTFTLTPNDAPGGLAYFLFSGGDVPGGAPTPITTAGALGGVQIGFNWQFDRKWLLGLETDFDGSAVRGSGGNDHEYVSGTPGFNADILTSINERVEWFGTVRPRLGYLLTNNLLIYGTGGLAYGKVKQNLTVADANGTSFSTPDGACVSGTNCFSGTSNRIATGWTAGGGLEFAIWNNWTIKTEYLYVRFPGNAFTASVIPVAGSPVNTAAYFVQGNSLALQVVRAGFNYKF